MFRTGFDIIPGLGMALLACATAWSAPPTGQNDIAAHINGKPVTYGELDAEVLKTDRAFFQKLYDARRAALDGILVEQALAPEAAKSGTTVDALLATKIAAQMTAVTDEDIQSFYDQNKAQMRNKPLAQMSKQIRDHLTRQGEAAGKASVLAEIKRTADVKIAMGPPRSPMVIADNDPMQGPATAAVTILEFSDFQ